MKLMGGGVGRCEQLNSAQMGLASWNLHGDGCLAASTVVGGLRCELSGLKGCLVRIMICANLNGQYAYDMCQPILENSPALCWFHAAHLCRHSHVRIR